MKLVSAALLLLFLTGLAVGSDADVALERFATLKKRSTALTAVSTTREVQETLGEPASKGNGGWGMLDVAVWRYLEYTDDAQFVLFEVMFDPQKGCSVVGYHLLRSKIEQGELKVATGKVIRVNPAGSSPTPDGFFCDVKFDDGALRYVGAPKLTRVKGVPEVGARITIRHYNAGGYYFVGQNSLCLASIEFERAGD